MLENQRPLMQLIADGIIPWNQADFLVTMGISESEFDAILQHMWDGVNQERNVDVGKWLFSGNNRPNLSNHRSLACSDRIKFSRAPYRPHFELSAVPQGTRPLLFALIPGIIE